MQEHGRILVKKVGYHFNQTLCYHTMSSPYSGNAGRGFREAPETPCSGIGDRVMGGLLDCCVLASLSSSPTRLTSSTSTVVSLESSEVEGEPSKENKTVLGVEGTAPFSSWPSTCLSRNPSVSASLTHILGAFGRGGVGEPRSVSLSLLSNLSDIGVRGNIFSVYDTLSAGPCRVRGLACAPPGCSVLPLRTSVFVRLVDRGEPGCHRGVARYELMNCDVEAGH